MVRRQPLLVAAAALCLAVPVGLLVWGTAAESTFSSSHQLGENRLTTGTVDLLAGRSITEVTAENLAPGGSQLVELELRNAGSLPLLISVTLTPEQSRLAETLTWEYWDETCDNRPPAAEIHSATRTQTAGDAPAGVPLAAEGKKSICIAAVVPLTVPNDMQGESARYNIVLDGVHDLPGGDSSDGDSSDGGDA